MKDIKIHRYIEEQNFKEKESLRKETEQKLGFSLSKQATESPNKQIKTKWKIVTACAACCCVLVCLAIVLPFLIKSSDNENPNRYSDAENYKWDFLDYNIAEYSEKTGKAILYLNWYDIAEDITTQIYFSINDPNDVIFLKESIANGETGDIVRYYITDNHTTVDVLEIYWKICSQKTDINGVTVNWCYDGVDIYAVFKFEDYVYYIDLSLTSDTELLFNIVENMLNTKNAAKRSIFCI